MFHRSNVDKLLNRALFCICMDLETRLQDLKSIDQDEVSECISEKVDDGVPQDQAVAICLSEAEEGSTEPENREITIQNHSSIESLASEPVIGRPTDGERRATFHTPLKGEFSRESVMEAVSIAEDELDKEINVSLTDKGVFVEPIPDTGVGPVEFIHPHLDVVESSFDNTVDITQKSTLFVGGDADGYSMQPCFMMDGRLSDEALNQISRLYKFVTGVDSNPYYAENRLYLDTGQNQLAHANLDVAEIIVRRAADDAGISIESHSFKVLEENETDTMTQEDNNSDVEDGKSLENPNFTVGDYVRWEFGGGSAEGEVIERKAEVGDSMSAGGNTFTIEEDDGPLYKMQEYDDEEEEFTNNVIKFEDALNEVQRPEEAPETAPRNRGKSKEKQKKHVNYSVKGGDLELTREKDGDVMVNVPIQATSEDRDGDIITDKGQESIIKQLESGEVPLVPNHGVGRGAATYDFRDIFGQFVGGEVVEGTTVGRARLREGTDMADELQDLLEQDMPVGFSVGFIPTETEERGEGGMLVDDLDLMEVSAVGVPSNPDAVPQAMGGAVAAAKQAGLSKQDIMSNVEKAFEDELDTMSTEQDKDETEGKETENQKMLSEDQVEAVTETVSGVMEQALADIQAEMEAMMDEDMESDGTHGDEEDEEEMSLDESDKTVSEDSSGRKIQGVDDSSVQEGKDETESLYSEPEGSAWGTTVQ